MQLKLKIKIVKIDNVIIKKIRYIKQTKKLNKSLISTIIILLCNNYIVNSIVKKKGYIIVNN